MFGVAEVNYFQSFVAGRGGGGGDHVRDKVDVVLEGGGGGD
jgi:hypothetical protein